MKWPIILQSEGSAALRTQDSLSGQCSSHTHLTFMEMTGITISKDMCIILWVGVSSP